MGTSRGFRHIDKRGRCKTRKFFNHSNNKSSRIQSSLSLQWHRPLQVRQESQFQWIHKASLLVPKSEDTISWSDCNWLGKNRVWWVYSKLPSENAKCAYSTHILIWTHTRVSTHSWGVCCIECECMSYWMCMLQFTTYNTHVSAHCKVVDFISPSLWEHTLIDS